MKSRVSWRKNLEKPQEPKIVGNPPNMSRFATGTMLIPTPQLVDALIRKIPKGELITVSELRRNLAAEFEVDVACPLTTGIFVRIVAEAAEEDRARGRRRLTPYWRVVKDDGSLNPKSPGGSEQQPRHLHADGLTFVSNPKKAPTVKEFERRLHTLK